MMSGGIAVLPMGSHVCYSRGMTDEIVAILKAKRDAVESLSFALDKAVNQPGNGTPLTGQGAVAFIKTWAEALDSMIPLDED